MLRCLAAPVRIGSSGSLYTQMLHRFIWVFSSCLGRIPEYLDLRPRKESIFPPPNLVACNCLDSSVANDCDQSGSGKNISSPRHNSMPPSLKPLCPESHRLSLLAKSDFDHPKTTQESHSRPCLFLDYRPLVV